MSSSLKHLLRHYTPPENLQTYSTLKSKQLFLPNGYSIETEPITTTPPPLLTTSTHNANQIPQISHQLTSNSCETDISHILPRCIVILNTLVPNSLSHQILHSLKRRVSNRTAHLREPTRLPVEPQRISLPPWLPRPESRRWFSPLPFPESEPIASRRRRCASSRLQPRRTITRRRDLNSREARKRERSVDFLRNWPVRYGV